jgi:uncharacterized protein YndB with AHSA1/START domain
MRTAHVQRTIPAPIEDVFEAISDHEGYSRFRIIQRSELLREGKEERNGLGALRRVTSRPLHFEEEVTAFERPARMDYLIRKVNAPFAHEGGTMLLTETPAGTQVDWKSTFAFTIPVVGGLLTRAMIPIVNIGFASALRDVERLLAGRASGAPSEDRAGAAQAPG